MILLHKGRLQYRSHCAIVRQSVAVRPGRAPIDSARKAGPLNTRLFPVWAVLLALAACTTTQRPSVPSAALAGYERFLVRGPLEPYQARGSAQFTYRGDTESGELSLQAESGPQYRIQLRARVTGSLALDVRFDSSDLLIVDYIHESYFLGANAPEIRNELFSLDMSPVDFQIALTARVPEQLFREGGGRLQPTEAEFSLDGDQYRFTLDASGLPVEWTKLRDGVPILRVEYRSFLALGQGSGPAVRLPERIRIYAGEPRPRIVLGLSEWRIGADAGAPPITFVPPQDVLERFRPQ